MSDKLENARVASKFFGLVVVVTSGLAVAVGLPAVGLATSVGAFVLAVILGALLTVTLVAGVLYLVATHELCTQTVAGDDSDEIIEEDDEEEDEDDLDSDK